MSEATAHPLQTNASLRAKTFIGALGVVHGLIGTVPLYAMKPWFSGLAVRPEPVYGILPLIFWTLTMIVTIKYVTLLMHADDHGAGGNPKVLALVVEGPRGRKVATAVA